MAKFNQIHRDMENALEQVAGAAWENYGEIDERLMTDTQKARHDFLLKKLEVMIEDVAYAYYELNEMFPRVNNKK